jgi:O-antigen/teichoic acid export membrane protein
MEGIGYAIDNLNLVNLVKNAPSILTFIFMLILLSFQKNIFLAILSYFISFFLLFLYVILNFWKYFKLKINFDALKIFIKHGIFVALSTSITFLLYRIDFFLIEKFYSKDVLGIYSVSISIGEINFIILSFIITAVAGKFFSSEGKAILKKSILILWIFQILAILFFLIFGKTFTNLLFSKEFNSSYLPSIIILLSTAIYNPSSIIAVYLNIKLGKTYIPFIISIVSLIIKSILAFFLIKELSIIGASISSLITYTLTFSIYVFVYFKLIKN